MSLAKKIPKDLSELLQKVAKDFPAMLRDNLVGIYLWGSLSYNAFDEACSDADFIVVTRRDLDDREFSEVDQWFKETGERNRWVKRMEMRFVIDKEFLDKSSRCCGFNPHTGKLVRHGSDGNPIIWVNIGQSGVTLWGKQAKRIAPQVSEPCLNEALLLELNYLKEDLTGNAGNRSGRAFLHNAYAVLTASRILYSAQHGTLVSKDQAYHSAMKRIPLRWRSVLRAAKKNRLKNGRGATTPQLERDAMGFLDFVSGEVAQAIVGQRGKVQKQEPG